MEAPATPESGPVPPDEVEQHFPGYDDNDLVPHGGHRETSNRSQEIMTREILREFMKIIAWFYAFACVLSLAFLIFNVLSGIYLLKRKHRIFSLAVAGINCLGIPFGTLLGVFTIIVLMRDSVRESYEGGSS